MEYGPALKFHQYRSSRLSENPHNFRHIYNIFAPLLRYKFHGRTTPTKIHLEDVYICDINPDMPLNHPVHCPSHARTHTSHVVCHLSPDIRQFLLSLLIGYTWWNIRLLLLLQNPLHNEPVWYHPAYEWLLLHYGNYIQMQTHFP